MLDFMNACAVFAADGEFELHLAGSFPEVALVRKESGTRRLYNLSDPRERLEFRCLVHAVSHRQPIQSKCYG